MRIRCVTASPPSEQALVATLRSVSAPLPETVAVTPSNRPSALSLVDLGAPGEGRTCLGHGPVEVTLRRDVSTQSAPEGVEGAHH